jgi:hypothetical protein
MEERLREYMGDIYHHPVSARLSRIKKEHRPMEFVYNSYVGAQFPKIQQTTYYHDLVRYVHPLPELYSTRFLFYPHDRVEGFPVPTLVKSRSLQDRQMSVLCNLNTIRHFMPVYLVNTNDIPLKEKKDVLVWRGADTGPGFGNNIPARPCSRENLVRTFAHSTNPVLDIALSGINSNQYSESDEYKIYCRPPMNMKELLQYKFILSVEGNDVASNLKWVLASNSVPFCPPFSIQSWILEDHLIPWEHYIPVRHDFTNLEDRVEWAINHPERCRRIAYAGKTYIMPFLNIKSEREIMTELLRRYAQNVHPH